MTRSEWIFLVVLIVNTIIAIVYMLWGILFRTKNEWGENRRISHVIRAVCIFLCPVVGLLFFLIGMLIRNIFFRTEVDLSDVVFSKERVRNLAKADEEREKNIVPIQEALAVTDDTQTRQLMLNVLKGDIDRSLSAIALALDSEDSETSHYAASVLSKALNEFRINVKKLDQEIHDEEVPVERQNDCCVLLIEYMNAVLIQQVFTSVEQKSFVQLLADTGQYLYDNERKLAEEQSAGEESVPAGQSPARIWMQAEHYGIIALRLTEIGDYERAGLWCDRAMEVYPGELISYQCRMQLLFTTNNGEQFLETLNQLKRSGIAIDNDTLEMIRVFQ